MTIQVPSVDDHNTPLDWTEETSWHGFTRNLKAKRYDVKLSICGVQRYLFSARGQEQAARIYDLALWKFAYHLRSYTPNFPDDFTFITQEQIDRELPRLNEIYRELPVRAGDGDFTEERLRERAFDNLSTPTPQKVDRYYDLLKHLMKFKLANAAGNTKTEQRRLDVDTRKLPSVTNALDNVRRLTAELDAAITTASNELNKNHEYYVRGKSEGTL